MTIHETDERLRRIRTYEEQLIEMCVKQSYNIEDGNIDYELDKHIDRLWLRILFETEQLLKPDSLNNV